MPVSNCKCCLVSDETPMPCMSEVLLNEHKSAIHYLISHRMLCWQKRRWREAWQSKWKSTPVRQRVRRGPASAAQAPRLPAYLQLQRCWWHESRQASVSALDWLINHFSTFSAGRSIALFTCPYINWSVFSSAVLLLRDQFEMIHLWSLLLIYAGSCAFKCPV